MAKIHTNCGDIDLRYNASNQLYPFINSTLGQPGGADLLRGGIKYFHNAMCQWAYSIPMKFNWVLIIYPKSDNLLKQIIEIETDRYESKGWQVSKGATATFDKSVQQTVGCIFAQGVDLPGESISTSSVGGAGEGGTSRGFLKTPITTGRESYSMMEVGFMDTNSSFVDSFIRPWSLIVAHKGLAELGEDSIKATIVVHQLGRVNTDQTSVIRKTFVFEDCAPVKISSNKLDYSTTTDYDKLQASFVYSRYFIADM